MKSAMQLQFNDSKGAKKSVSVEVRLCIIVKWIGFWGHMFKITRICCSKMMLRWQLESCYWSYFIKRSLRRVSMRRAVFTFESVVKIQ